MQEDIVVRNLWKSYGSDQVLKNFTYVFPAGQVSFVMGKSGCGKTTLLSILMGLVPYDSGEVKGLEGRKISAVFQEDRLVEGLTVEKNLYLACKKNVTADRMEKILEKLDLFGCLKRKTTELSGGMKRRVAIARALLVPFDILFLDEPLRGLDAGTKNLVLKAIMEFSVGKTVIYITHGKEETFFSEESHICHMAMDEKGEIADV